MVTPKGEAGLLLRNRGLAAGVIQLTRQLEERDARIKTLVGQLSEARGHGFSMQIAHNTLLEWAKEHHADFDAAAYQTHVRGVLESKGFKFATPEEIAERDRQRQEAIAAVKEDAKRQAIEEPPSNVVPIRGAASSDGEGPLDAG